jgi:hypothetical protein
VRPAATPPGGGKPRGVRLRSCQNVRADLARVYRRLVGGELEEGMARVRCYVLQTIASVIRDEKLADIEAQLGELKAMGVLK